MTNKTKVNSVISFTYYITIVNILLILKICNVIKINFLLILLFPIIISSSIALILLIGFIIIGLIGIAILKMKKFF